jgi:hypothetical protein
MITRSIPLTNTIGSSREIPHRNHSHHIPLVWEETRLALKDRMKLLLVRVREMSNFILREERRVIIWGRYKKADLIISKQRGPHLHLQRKFLRRNKVSNIIAMNLIEGDIILFMKRLRINNYKTYRLLQSLQCRHLGLFNLNWQRMITLKTS